MQKLYKSAKAWLSFVLGRNPRIELTRKDYRKFIPEPYEGVVIVSADFELAWAWRYDKLNPDPINNSLVLAQKERNNIPKLIELSARYNIPVTWGTVGHLFLSSCNHGEQKPHIEIERLPYFENEWWKYNSDDWFDTDPCSSVEKAPEWYAPDLINQILNSEVVHEIANHSFSHISCDDDTCTPAILESELKASQEAADSFNVKLESFIFPGHTMGNYDTLQKTGYTSMRTNFINILGYPQYHANGLWEHKTTMELSYNNLFSTKHNLSRYKVIINKCIKNRQVCNLWFHPSFEDINIEIILPEIYKFLDANRKILWITTMKEYTNWLSTKAKNPEETAVK